MNKFVKLANIYIDPQDIVFFYPNSKVDTKLYIIFKNSENNMSVTFLDEKERTKGINLLLTVK